MSPKLVVIVAATVPSLVASAPAASTSRAGSCPSEGYSQVVVSPAGAEDVELGASSAGSLAVPSPSLPHPARTSTDRQAATEASRFSMRPIVASARSHLLVGVRVAAEQPAVGLGEAGDRGDLLVGELEAEDVEVLGLAGRVRGLRDRQRAELDVPPQDHLAGRHPVRLRGRGDGVLVERSAPLAHGAPGLRADAEALVHLAHVVLREPRVQLHLVDRRHDTGVVDDPAEVLLGEVGDADRADQPVLLELDERAPRLDVLPLARVGPVDQVQVGALEAQAVERPAHGGDGVVVRMVPAGDLAGDEDLVAGDARATDRLADLDLVAVVHRGVHEPVAGLDRADDRRGAVVVAQRVGAEADRRDGGAVVEVVRRDVSWDRGHASTVGAGATPTNRTCQASMSKVQTRLNACRNQMGPTGRLKT